MKRYTSFPTGTERRRMELLRPYQELIMDNEEITPTEPTPSPTIPLAPGMKTHSFIAPIGYATVKYPEGKTIHTYLTKPGNIARGWVKQSGYIKIHELKRGFSTKSKNNKNYNWTVTYSNVKK